MSLSTIDIAVFIGFIVAVIAAVALLATAERTGIGAGSDRKRLDDH